MLITVAHDVRPDWPTFWSALSAIASTLALTAFTLTAVFAKQQVTLTRRLDATRLTHEVLNAGYVTEANAAYSAFVLQHGGNLEAARHEVRTQLGIWLRNETGFVDYHEAFGKVLGAWSYLSRLYVLGAFEPTLAVEAAHLPMVLGTYVFESALTFEIYIGTIEPKLVTYFDDCLAYAKQREKLRKIYPWLTDWTPALRQKHDLAYFK